MALAVVLLASLVLSTGLSAGLASVVWGAQSVLAGLATGIAATAIVAAIIGLLRLGTRPTARRI